MSPAAVETVADQQRRKAHWAWVRSHVDLLDVARDRLRGLKVEGNHWQALCPFHDDHHPSLTINPGVADAVKTGARYAGRFKCWVCPNVFGSVIDLVAYLDQCEASEAMETLYQQYGGPDAVPNSSRAPRVPSKTSDASDDSDASDPSVSSKMLPDEVEAARQAWYAALWPRLTLKADHRRALMQRGLSQESVDAHGFRSVPDEGDAMRIGWQTRLADRDPLPPWPEAGIPGMSTDHDGQLTGVPGLLIPAWSVTHRILGAQIRPDRADDHKKYRWWSSPHRHGGSAMTSVPSWIWPLDLPGSWDDAPEVILTEGLLKAIVIAELFGIPTVGVAGFTQWERILPTLDTLAIGTVTTAFDADVWEDAKKAPVEQRCWAALRHRYPARTIQALRWDGTQAKGLDDALAAAIVIHPQSVP